MFNLFRGSHPKEATTSNGNVPSTARSAGWELPERHLAAERAQLARHRAAVGIDRKLKLATDVDVTDIPGIAISGGGIRSAVFSLGVMQLLADEDKLREFSYISTVSGGSYLGAFYGSLFVPDDLRQGARLLPKERFAETAKEASSRVQPKKPADSKDAVTPIEYLRNNCNYLVPNGLDDVLQSFAFSARNWFALQYVIGVSLLTIILWLNWVEMLPFIDQWLPKSMSLPGLNDCPGVRELRWKEMNQCPSAEHVRWMVPAALGLAIMGLVISPLSRAYWLTQNLSQDLRSSFKALPWLTLLLVGILAISAVEAVRYNHVDSRLFYDERWSIAERLAAGWAWLIIFSQVLAILYLRLAWTFTKGDKQTAKRWFRGADSVILRGSDSRPFVDRVRNALTNAYTTAPSIRSYGILSGPMQLVLWLFALALIDLGGAYAELALRSHLEDLGAPSMFATATLGSGGIWAFGRFLLAKSDSVEKAYKRISKIILASIAAAIASLLTLLIWSTLAHVIVSRIQHYVPQFFSILDGLCIQFLNLSTYQRLYSTRLTRTFLGASNRTRLKEQDQRDVTSLVSGDSISMGQYYHADSCAPVHLINATINKTVDWNSSLVHRGARGLSMCVGPAGISIGAMLGVLTCDWQAANDISTPAAHERDSEKTPGIWLESLTLGDWIAISGAAVSTGLGNKTRTGYSLLLGIANIRLGYWWDTYSAPFRDGALAFRRTRVPLPSRDIRWHSLRDGLFGTQFCLLNELLGQFDGPRARRWFLTDGGHFENTGAYELLRRGLKFIILLDNGADRDFNFDDVATLMRLARVDFGIEVYTSDAPFQQPERIYVNFENVARSFHEFTEKPHCLAVRMLTRFPDESHGQIILVKPRLTTLAPHDVWEYRKNQGDFPHETTANQFFNDVQWESHRALGESQARSLFCRRK